MQSIVLSDAASSFEPVESWDMLNISRPIVSHMIQLHEET